MCKSLCFSLLLLFLIPFQNPAYLNMFSWCKWRISNGQAPSFLQPPSPNWIIAQSLKQNLHKKYQQLTCSWFSSDSYDAFPSSDSMTSPSFWQNHTFILNNHPSSTCNCKPTSVLVLKRTDIGMKENPEIMVQFYFKWLYVLLYLDYKCKTLAVDGQDKKGLQLEKIGPSFSSLTPVCRHVIEHMNNHFLCFVISACRGKTF